MLLLKREIEPATQQVSVHPLTQVLIAWDFYADIIDDRDGTVWQELSLLRRACGTSRDEEDVKLEPLNARFKSVEDYWRQFLPLMLLECKQSIYRAKEMDINPNSGDIMTKVDVKTRSDSFLVTVQKSGQCGMYSQGDLVMLYRPRPADDCEYFIENFKQRFYNQFGEKVKLFQSRKEPLVTIETVNKESDTPGTPKKHNDNNSDVLFDAEGRPLKSPNPLMDNPNHLLGIVEGINRDSIAIKVLIRESHVDREELEQILAKEEATKTVTAEEIIAAELDDNEEKDDGTKGKLKRMSQLEFLLGREAYRMRQMVDALTDSDPYIYLCRVMNLVTVYREYQAVMSLPDMFLKEYLLNPCYVAGDDSSMSELPRASSKSARRRRRRREKTEERFEISSSLQSTLEGMYNTSQMEALNDCLKASGITCIQGPPGTGKTTTIMGILSVILNAVARKKKDQAPGVSLDEDGSPQCMSDADDDRNEQRRKATLIEASPWLYKENYEPWYETQNLTMEDLEDPTPLPTARHEGTIVDLLKDDDLASVPKRVLVCAPSNAAIDEIMRRLTSDPVYGGGIFDNDGVRYNPSTIRVGPNCHPDLMKYSLQERVQGRLQASAAIAQQSEEFIKLALLEEARIVCSTLSVAGSKELSNFAGGFDTVVVDEASQGVELSTLVPLKLNCHRLILVGDPRQLPATVFSKVALDLKYDQSLFQRLERAGHKINMLSVQYRMHPAISAFPSKRFYDGNLKDWEGIKAAAVPPIDYYSIPIFKPVVFFSIDSTESVENTSRINRDEVLFICQLLDLLRCIFSYLPASSSYKTSWMSRTAVISPYAEQVKLCSKQIKATFGLKPSDNCPIDVNTVDGFQGREKDFVIFSAVRAEYVGDSMNPRKAKVGFLADQRRMNVALTRARLNLWIVGNGRYLQANPEWGKFVDYCNENEYTFNVHYGRYSKDAFLKFWLLNFIKRRSDTVPTFETQIPGFLNRLQDDINLLTAADSELRENYIEEEQA